MITVYGGGPHFGLPDPSPFVCKTYIHLKMAGLAYTATPADFPKTPRRKVPYISDDSVTVSDSEHIRRHIETKYGFDFDKGHAPEALARAWAIARMLEERFYWLIVYERWAIEENFERGPKRFFDAAPAPVRPFIRRMVKRMVTKALWAQGTSRHKRGELREFGRGDLNALSVLMGGSQWLLGNTPCGADATVIAMLMGAFCPLFDSDLRREGEAFANLLAYEKRGRETFFPDLRLA